MVSEDRRVCVLWLGKMEERVDGFVCLNEKWVWFRVGVVKKDRVELKVNGIDLVSVGGCERKYVIVEGSGGVSGDIEGVGVFVYLVEDLVGR